MGGGKKEDGGGGKKEEADGGVGKVAKGEEGSKGKVTERVEEVGGARRVEQDVGGAEGTGKARGETDGGDTEDDAGEVDAESRESQIHHN